MNIIYEPRGKAKEYADLSANLYRGCSHGCLYCYAPSATFKERAIFHSPNFISPRKDVLNNLKIDAISHDGCSENVLLSFTTDPYQPIENRACLTRKAIKILNDHDIGVTILTKGGKLAQRDFDILKLDSKNKFGVTLTCVDLEESLKWEPSASIPTDRIDSLVDAWTQGISTYVSFEPVIDPESVYKLIEMTHEFVDFYKVGKLNYHPHAKNINWPEFRNNIIEILSMYNKKFMLKKDLLTAN